MFTEIIRVGRLQNKEVNKKVLEDINRLLKKQRQDAKSITEEHLLECMGKMGVVVAWDDNEHVVGLGVLTQSGGLNFSCAEIRHLIISDGQDILAVGVRIVTALRDIYLHGIEYIDAGVWVQDEEIKNVFTALGFKEKPGSRFRLRTNHQRRLQS